MDCTSALLRGCSVESKAGLRQTGVHSSRAVEVFHIKKKCTFPMVFVRQTFRGTS